MIVNITSTVSLRYLISGHKNKFFGFITILSILGIAIAIAAMIVVLSVINGFETDLRKRFLAANAHILVYQFPSGIKNHGEGIKKIYKNFGKEITGASPFVHMETMGKRDSMLHSVLVRGIDPVLREKVQSLEGLIRPKNALQLLTDEIKDGVGPETPPSVIIGVGLARAMSVKTGETIGLISPMADDPLSSVSDYKVVGIYDSGLSHYDNKLAILSVPSAQKLFNMDKVVTGIEIGMKDPWQSPKLMSKLQAKYPNVSVRQWQDYNKNMFEALKYERGLISILVALVALVGGFNILTTLFVSVVQKGKDIAILKSLGAQNNQIITIFIKQGLIMGIAGSLIGGALAYGCSLLLEKYEFIKLPEIYMLAKLPIEYNPNVYITTCTLGVIISTLAGIIPARNAAKFPPSEGLKGNARE